MAAGTDFLDGCVIVMAHPDDELLWASSLLRRASRIVLCFGPVPRNPALTNGRTALAARFPLPAFRFLGIVESAVFARARWPDPKETPEGLAIAAAPGRARDYVRSYRDLLAALPAELEGARTVVTHNPWGEYGHEHHVQVLRAVEALQPRFGYRILVSCYAAQRSLGLMARTLGRLGDPTPELATDAALTAELGDLYRETGTWTWFADYRWPGTERFFALRPAGAMATSGAVAPLNMVNNPFATEPLLVREARRYLGALVRRVRR
jgi:hypothetical protein